MKKTVLPERIFRNVILLAFALSGMTALIYEVAWARQLQVIFGSTIYAVSRILSAFMARFTLNAYLFKVKILKGKLAMSILFTILILGTSNAFALECEEYQQDVFWSSGFNIYDGAVNYYPLNFNGACLEGQCFVKNIKAYTRVLDMDAKLANGFVELSEPSKTDCNELFKSNFSRYIAYQAAVKSSDAVFAWDCGEAKQDNTCDMMLDLEGHDCLAVKVGAEMDTLTDAIRLNYTLCKEEQNVAKMTKRCCLSWLLIILFAAIIVLFLSLNMRKRAGKNGH